MIIMCFIGVLLASASGALVLRVVCKNCTNRIKTIREANTAKAKVSELFIQHCLAYFRKRFRAMPSHPNAKPVAAPTTQSTEPPG